MARKRKELVELEGLIGAESAAEVESLWKETDQKKSLMDFWKNMQKEAGSGEEAADKQEEPEKTGVSKDPKVVDQKISWEEYLSDHPEFVALNKQMAKKYGLIDSEIISKAKEAKIISELKDDNLKIILLQFFKDLLHAQGFKALEYKQIGNCSEEYAGMSCRITWSDGSVTSGIGDAHKSNTNSFAKYYLAPIAENRSFVRAVKAFFNIPLLAKDEIGDIPDEDTKKEENAPIGPHVALQRVVKSKINKSSFEAFKAFLVAQIKENPKTAWIQPEEYDDWKGYADWSDIKKTKVLELITKVKELPEEQ